jgi:hypothetical protein
MLSNDIILFFHIILFYILALSPLVTDCYLKKLILIIIVFLLFQYLLKYGKCGIINIERFFLKEKFKEGFFFKLIKPVICYKRNIIYKNYFMLIIIYILILFSQLKIAGCSFNFYNELKEMYYKKI